jgi:tetratricopeptide (TPR) repeat protein
VSLFLSYSSIDGRAFVQQVHDGLTAESPPFSVWLDLYQLPPGQPWDTEIDRALRDCEAVIYLITSDSVREGSKTSLEFRRALQYKKPVVPLRFHPSVVVPLLLEGLQEIDFVSDFEAGMARLRVYLRWLRSAEGQRYVLERRKESVQRDFERDPDAASTARAAEELEEIQLELQALAQSPPQSRPDPEPHPGMERETRTERATASAVDIVNRAPASASKDFQDRVVETGLLGEFLEDPSKRVLTVSGRAGVGKTAMVCRALLAVERGLFPDDRRLAVRVEGIVYLGTGPAREISFATFHNDVAQLLPGEMRANLQRTWDESKSVEGRVFALTSMFARRLVVVLLDNFEDLLDSETQDLADREFAEALHQLLRVPEHGLKLIITTRAVPRELALDKPARQLPIDLDEGLRSPYAERLLQAMDRDGKLGLRDAPDSVLSEIRERTLGYPRALEAFVAILRADRHTSVQDLLALEHAPSEVVEELVEAAFHRLPPRFQQVVQALAIYGRPVTPQAIDFILQPWLPGIESEPMLGRLVGMYLVRKDSGRFFLHQVDRAYALSRVPTGVPGDWAVTELPFTLSGLRHRAAEYFRKLRTEPGTWRSIEDLGPALAEFELLSAAGDIRAAVDVLSVLIDPLSRVGHDRQIVHLADQALQNAGAADRVRLLGWSGEALASAGEDQQAITRLREALAEAAPDHDTVELISWRLSLADSESSLGNPRSAAEEYNLALSLTPNEVPVLAARALLGLGLMNETLGQYLEADHLYRRALERLLDGVEVSDNGKSVTLDIASVPRVHDPFAWRAGEFEVTEEDSDTPALAKLVVLDLSETSLHDGSETSLHDAGEAEPSPEGPASAAETTKLLLQPHFWLANVWWRRAGLFARTDRLEAAEQACILAVQIFELCGEEFAAMRALNLLKGIRAEYEATSDFLAIQKQELAEAVARGDQSAQARLLSELGPSHLNEGRLDEAQDTYRELWQLAAAGQNRSLLTTAEIGLAQVDWSRGEHAAAVRRLETLLREQAGADPPLQADIHRLLGDIERSRFEWPAARGHYLRVREIVAEFGSLPTLIDIERALAALELDTRDYDSAVARLVAVVALALTLGVPSIRVSILVDLANARLLAGDRAGSIESAEEAATVAETVSLPVTQAELLGTLGQIWLELALFPKAEQALRNALEHYRTLERHGAEVYTLIQLASVYDRSDDQKQQLGTAREALDVAQRYTGPVDQRNAREALALALGDSGAHEDAVALIEQVLEEEPDNPIHIGNAGWIMYQAGRYERSLDLSRAALARDPTQTWTIRNLGHAYLAMGRPEEAEREYQRAIAERRGGEDFRETIRVVRKLLARDPEVPRGAEMLRLLERTQAELEAQWAATADDRRSPRA